MWNQKVNCAEPEGTMAITRGLGRLEEGEEMLVKGYIITVGKNSHFKYSQ